MYRRYFNISASKGIVKILLKTQLLIVFLFEYASICPVTNRLSRKLSYSLSPESN